MLHRKRFSVADAVAELETAIGIYLLFEQEAGAGSIPAKGALVRVKHALGHLQWCRGLADELLRESGRPALDVLVGGLSSTRSGCARDGQSDGAET